ncbi:MAG TPA: hypothetical protein PLK29_03875, partial [Chiayiivirga sp.]|nr:hypothetical protein [Chiayiivirga sp.]
MLISRLAVLLICLFTSLGSRAVEIQPSDPGLDSSSFSLDMFRLREQCLAAPLSTQPVGPTVTVNVKSLFEGDVRLVFWRQPCSPLQSVVLLTVFPVSDVPFFVPLFNALVQGGRQFNTASFQGADLSGSIGPYIHVPTTGYLFLSMLENEYFNENAEFTIHGLQLDVGAPPITIPAYNPAAYNTTMFDLDIARSGDGVVVSAPYGLNCGEQCRASFVAGVSVELTPFSGAGYWFDSWEGECAGSYGTCVVSMTKARHVVAKFTSLSGRDSEYRTLNLTASGSGTVSTTPYGVDCGSSCRAYFEKNSNVVLRANPAPGWKFRSWGGACVGVSVSICTISMLSDQNASVTFELVDPGA